MNRASKTCIECGKPKEEHLHFLRQRCDACNKPWRIALAKANAAVAAAVRTGLLPKAKTLRCVDCGEQAFDWDHRDYAKPLEVQPVCRRCNQRRGHAMYPREAA